MSWNGTERRAAHADLSVAVGRLIGQMEAMREAFAQQARQSAARDAKIDRLEDQASRWKGGLAVLLTAAGIAGSIGAVLVWALARLIGVPTS